MKGGKKIVACLDMGTTKLACLIAAIDSKEIVILGYGYRESKGIISSAISDMKFAQKSIANVVADAEKMAGFNIDKLVIGLSAKQTISEKRDAVTKISSDIVRNSDITNLAGSIRNEYKKNNREVIHLIPLQYRIDDSTPVQNPRYMSGEFLTTKFHIVSTSTTTIKNIENCLKRCGLVVNNYIAESYASALSCLSDNEINLGTLLIDIGSSSTSYSIISDGKLINTGNFAVGGIHITRDIATIISVDFETAEEIKNLNSSLNMNPLQEREFIQMKISRYRDETNIIRVTKGELREIIQSRVEEIFESVKSLLDKTGYGSHLVANIVLTGGVANIIGIERVAAEIFQRQVRIGYPVMANNLPSELDDPAFSSSVGMLVFLKNIYLKEKIKDGFETKNSFLKKIIEKLMAI